MKRILLILSIIGIIATVPLVVTVALRLIWPRDYIQGSLEIWHGFGGINSGGALELKTQKWLITDDSIYYLEFLPFCQLIGINEGESANSISIGNKWFLIENGAIYRVKGDVTNGAPTAPLDQWTLKADDKGNFTKVTATEWLFEKRRPKAMQVNYIEFVRPADRENK
jgi:hypothetical protein